MEENDKLLKKLEQELKDYKEYMNLGTTIESLP